MEKKSFDYKIKGIDTEKGVVEFYSSKFGNRDSDGDIMQKGCFAKTLSENFKRIRHLQDHYYSVGVPQEIKEDDFGLLCKSKLMLKIQKGLETFEMYKAFAENDNTLEHSIGFATIKKEDEEKINDMTGERTRTRIIKEVKLYDITTMTTWGANPDTPMVSLKNEQDIEKHINLLRKLLNSKFTDEKLLNFEKHLNEIESLLTKEPDNSTLSEKEPIELVNNFFNRIKL